MVTGRVSDPGWIEAKASGGIRQERPADSFLMTMKPRASAEMVTVEFDDNWSCRGSMKYLPQRSWSALLKNKGAAIPRKAILDCNATLTWLLRNCEGSEGVKAVKV